MRMNDTYQDAVSGTLKSVDSGSRTNMTVTNGTPLHLLVYWVGLDGLLYGRNRRTTRLTPGYPGQVLDPGATIAWKNIDRSSYFIAKVGYSSAFAAAWQADRDNAAVTLTGRDLLARTTSGRFPPPPAP